jgi:peptide/nickel transport system permease protein
MGTYILRRLLLMIPTVIGMTFMVFALIALSPGGVGAALSVSGGGQMDAGSRAQQQAYLEDRYGLDDSVFVQYVRWLGRVSPVKFGTRDQRAPSGELVRPPKPVKPLPLYEIFIDAMPAGEDPPPFEFEPGSTQAERTAVYRAASGAYAQARGAYVRARAGYELAAGQLLRDAGMERLVERDGTLKPGARVAHLRTALDEVGGEAALRVEFDATLTAYGAAESARKQLDAVFRARPFPEAGFPIIPGWVSVATPDLGMSFSRGRPVSQLIETALPVTLLLNFVAFPIVYLVAIPTGMLAATRRGGAFDVLSGGLFVALWSIPIVWAGVLMMGYLANRSTGLGWFPVTGLHDVNADSMRFLPGPGSDGTFQIGFVLDTLWHMCLPVACLVYAGFAVLSKQTRAAMLDNFNADYVRTAKAKGVASKDIVFRHVFRNSLLPLITMFVSIFPAMLGGSVIVEQIFSINGMGKMVIDAIFLRDREVLLANAMIIGIVNMLALLLADILYAMADPRISYD